MLRDESKIRPVIQTNYVVEVLYLQALEDFFEKVDTSRWTKLDQCPVCQSKAISLLFAKNRFSYFRCANCEHQFINPMPDEASVHYWYANSVSQKEFNRMIETTTEEHRHSLYQKRLHQLQQIAPFRSLLEIGCGTGGFLKYVKEKLPDVKVYGCDVDPFAIGLCRKNGIEGICEAAEKLEYRKYDIDIIVMWEVVEHLIQSGLMLGAIAKNAKQGTHLVMSTPNNEGFDFQILGKVYRAYLPPGHLNLFSVKSIDTVLRSVGYSSVEVKCNGQIDVSIVKGYYENNRYNPDPFFKRIFDENQMEFLKDFQDLLIKHNLSGNMLVHARV
ncbi:conserved hypothetical protein [Gammaproteobacteria bacterium]